MASTSRLWAYWRRKIGHVLMCAIFLFLGYHGVLVMKSSDGVAYMELPAKRGEAQVEDEAKFDLSLQEAHQAKRGEAQVEDEAKFDLSLQEAHQAPPTPLVILVLSSMPRGGSTLLTDLLSSVQDSVVLFEPLWNIEKTDCYKDVACVQQYLADMFSCSFKPEFETWLKSKGVFFHFFSPEARDCLNKSPAEDKAACLEAMNLQERCEAAPVVIVKVIRARLSWIHNLLEDSLINLKVIHLIRDPRGSINSIARFGWESNPHSRCSDLEDDMANYQEMREVFPATVMQVRYEQLCLHPAETSSDMFRFLFGNATLPTSVTSFLDNHMMTGHKKAGSMSTVKNSTKEYEAWRYKISSSRLKTIEEEPVCVKAIERMGHAIFGSYKNVSNPKLPLILNT